jgi:hypothetical protein
MVSDMFLMNIISSIWPNTEIRKTSKENLLIIEIYWKIDRIYLFNASNQEVIKKIIMITG